MMIYSIEGHGISKEDISFEWLLEQRYHLGSLYHHVLKKTGRAYPGPKFDYTGTDNGWIEQDDIFSYAVRLLDMPVPNWTVERPNESDGINQHGTVFVYHHASAKPDDRGGEWRFQPGKVGIFLGGASFRYSSYGSELELIKSSHRKNNYHAVLAMFYDEDSEAGNRMRHGKVKPQFSDQGRLLAFDRVLIAEPDPSPGPYISPGDIVVLNSNAPFASVHPGDDLAEIIESEFDKGRSRSTLHSVEVHQTRDEKMGWVRSSTSDFYDYPDCIDPVADIGECYPVLEREGNVLFIAVEDNIVRVPLPYVSKRHDLVSKKRSQDKNPNGAVVNAITEYFDDTEFFTSVGLIRQYIVEEKRRRPKARVSDLVRDVGIPSFERRHEDINRILELRGLCI